MGKELGALPNKKPTLTAIGTVESPTQRDFPLNLSKPQFHVGFQPSSRISIKALGMDEEDPEEDPQEDPEEDSEEDPEEDPEEDSEEDPEEDIEEDPEEVLEEDLEENLLEDYEPDSPFYYGKKEFEHLGICEQNDTKDNAVVEDEKKYGSFHVKGACDADIKHDDVPNEIGIQEQDNNEHFFLISEEAHGKKNLKTEVFVGGLDNAVVEDKKKNGRFNPKDACDVENMKYVDFANEIGIEEEGDNPVDDKQKHETVDNDNDHLFSVSEVRHGKQNQKTEVYVGGLDNDVVEDENKFGSLNSEDASSVVEEDLKYVGGVDAIRIEEAAKCADEKQVEMVNYKHNEHRFAVPESRHKEKNQKTQVRIGSLDRNTEGNFVGGDKHFSLPADDAGDVVDEDLEYVSYGTESDKEDEDDDPEDVMVNTDDWDCHAALKDRNKVFIGGLDDRATEKDIKKVFSGVGEITTISLLKNSLTNKRKGFAILTFATSEQAKRSIAEIKNPTVNGKLISVSPYKDRNTLFLGNICKRWTKAILENRLKHFGVDKLENLKLVEDLENARQNRGFAFLCFSSYLDAMNAYKRLQMRDVDLGADRSAKVAFAFPEPWNRQNVRGKLSRPDWNGTWRHVLRGNYPLSREHGSRSIRAGSFMHQKREKRPTRSEEHGGKQAIIAKSDKAFFHTKNHKRSSYHRLDELDELALRDRPYEKYHYYRRDELDELALRDRPAKKYDSVVKKHRRSRHPPGNLVDLYGDASHDQARSCYVDEGFGQRFGWCTSSSHHIEQHRRDNDSFPLLKRRHSELDDIPPTAPLRVSRPRLDNESSAEVSHHGHAYSNRVERFYPTCACSNSTYHLRGRACEYYRCHQDMGNIRGSAGDVDYGNLYSPGYGNVYSSPDGGRLYSSSLHSRGHHRLAHVTYHEDIGFE